MWSGLLAFSMGEGWGLARAAGRGRGRADEGRPGGGESGGEGAEESTSKRRWAWTDRLAGLANGRTDGRGRGPHATIERALFRRVSPGESLRAPTRSTPRSPGRRRLVSISCLPCFLLPLPTPRIDRPAPSLSTARRRSSPPRSTC